MVSSIKSQLSSPIYATRAMLWLLILGYSFVLVGQTTYQNYRMNREIQFQKERIAELEKKKRVAQLSLIYFQTNAFKETEARKRLNLKGKDEHVVALPAATTEATLSVATGSISNDEPSSQEKPFMAWWNLFFNQEL